MGFLKKLFGRQDKTPARRVSRSPRPAPVEKPASGGPDVPDTSEMTVKQLIRTVGLGGKEGREAAARRLQELGDRSAIRPLINSYLNYGDAAVLEAIQSYGNAITTAATNEAYDAANIGERRARLMDVLAATGDTSMTGAIRESVGVSDLVIHNRACAALARLGDLTGVDRLAADLQQGIDAPRRTLALRTLTEIRSIPGAQAVIDAHLDRYLAQGGAIPKQIEVSAPRLVKPDVSMVAHLIEEITKTTHDLEVVIGSGASDVVRNRSTELKRGLAGHDLFLLTAQMSPEEQMNDLEEARDRASANPEHTVLVIGNLPSPNDNPPLRHFLTPGLGHPYSAKIIVVDPHEYGLLMDWWHYIDDKAEVPTNLQVVISASSPGRSAISEEEYLIHQLTPPERRGEFGRALLAHL